MSDECAFLVLLCITNVAVLLGAELGCGRPSAPSSADEEPLLFRDGGKIRKVRRQRCRAAE
jgi:hypothetical protein